MFDSCLHRAGNLLRTLKERCNLCFLLIFAISMVMLGLFSSSTIKRYPPDCISNYSFPYEDVTVSVRTPSKLPQCKLLLGKYNAYPVLGTMAIVNGTYDSAFIFSYSTAIFSSFYENSEQATALPDVLKEEEQGVQLLSIDGTRVYFLVLTLPPLEFIQLQFFLNNPQMPKKTELLEARKSIQIFLPVIIIFLVFSVFLCCHLKCFGCGQQGARNSRVRTQPSQNASSGDDDFQVDLPPCYDNFAQYPEAKFESLPPQYRADVDLPAYETAGSVNQAFQPPKYENLPNAGQQNQTA